MTPRSQIRVNMIEVGKGLAVDSDDDPMIITMGQLEDHILSDNSPQNMSYLTAQASSVKPSSSRYHIDLK